MSLPKTLLLFGQKVSSRDSTRNSRSVSLLLFESTLPVVVHRIAGHLTSTTICKDRWHEFKIGSRIYLLGEGRHVRLMDSDFMSYKLGFIGKLRNKKKGVGSDRMMSPNSQKPNIYFVTLFKKIGKETEYYLLSYNSF